MVSCSMVTTAVKTSSSLAGASVLTTHRVLLPSREPPAHREVFILKPPRHLTGHTWPLGHLWGVRVPTPYLEVPIIQGFHIPCPLSRRGVGKEHVSLLAKRTTWRTGKSGVCLYGDEDQRHHSIRPTSPQMLVSVLHLKKAMWLVSRTGNNKEQINTFHVSIYDSIPNGSI